MSENEYGKALQEAFDSKTPAQHLADSKYMGRGLTVAAARKVFWEQNPILHAELSTAQMTVPQIVDALRMGTLTVANPPTTKQVTVLFQMVIDEKGRLMGMKIPKDSCEASQRLLSRLIKKGTVRSVVVNHIRLL
jgi:hypothetical protein